MAREVETTQPLWKWAGVAWKSGEVNKQEFDDSTERDLAIHVQDINKLLQAKEQRSSRLKPPKTSDRLGADECHPLEQEQPNSPRYRF